MSERIEHFDILRGLAIIGVVAIHSSGSGLQFSEQSINFNFTVLWRNMFNFAVPIFIAISGFFLAKKSIKNSLEYIAFQRKQIPRVYIPLLVWSSVWFAFSVIVYKSSFINELFKIATFQSSDTFYFIALIIQYYLLLPILQKLATTKGLIFSIFLSISMTWVIFYLRYYTEINLPLIFYAGNFPTWLMFFVLGLCLGSNAIKRISNKYLIIFIVLFYLISCVESYVLISLFSQSGDSVSAVKSSSFIYSFFLIIFLFNNPSLIKSKLLKHLGDVSFGVYLTHMLAMAIIARLVLHIVPSIKEISYVYQFFLIGSITISCFVGIIVVNKIISTKQARLLGFK